MNGGGGGGVLNAGGGGGVVNAGAGAAPPWAAPPCADGGGGAFGLLESGVGSAGGCSGCSCGAWQG